MPRITVRFNYFRLYLENEEDDGLFNFRNLLDYILVQRNNNYSFNVNVADYGEIDTNAFHFDEQRNMYYLQISKLRNENLPGKKRISEPREDLALEDNEYVSEFLTLIYDAENMVSMIQVNRNSLSIKELEIYLTQLRQSWKRENGLDDDDYFVKCRIVADPDKLNEVRDADYIRKIILNGSRINLDALNDDQSLKRISETIGELQGVNFKLEISVDSNAPRDASLEKENLLEIIDEINGNEIGINTKVAIKEDLNTSVELVDLVQPRMTDIIRVEHENRRNIGVEYLYNTFMNDVYIEKRERVRRLLN